MGERGPEVLMDDQGNKQVVGAQGPEVVTPQRSGTVIPNEALKQVLAENPGLGRSHSVDDTAVIFASPERVEAARKSQASEGGTGGPGHSEYWPADEEGTPGYGHPMPGKKVLEVFDPELMNDPEKLKNAIYGELLHGAKEDPVYKKLRNEFKEAYTPEEKKRIKNKESWWEDANGKNPNDAALHDAYIRGYLNENAAAMKGHKELGETMYSKRQMRTLEKIKEYLKTGEEPE
jgi:hypothetical protein